MTEFNDLMRGTILELEEPVSFDEVRSWRLDAQDHGAFMPGATFRVVEVRSLAMPGCIEIENLACHPPKSFGVPRESLRKFRIAD